MRGDKKSIQYLGELAEYDSDNADIQEKAQVAKVVGEFYKTYQNTQPAEEKDLKQFERQLRTELEDKTQLPPEQIDKTMDWASKNLSKPNEANWRWKSEKARLKGYEKEIKAASETLATLAPEDPKVAEALNQLEKDWAYAKGDGNYTIGDRNKYFGRNQAREAIINKQVEAMQTTPEGLAKAQEGFDKAFPAWNKDAFVEYLVKDNQKAGLKGEELDVKKQEITQTANSIVEQSLKYGVSPSLALALRNVESRGGATTSPKGAVGFMQVTPQTVAEVKAYFTQSDKVKDMEKSRIQALDINKDNVELGVMALRMYMEYYDGEAKHALAAYNAGFKNYEKDWKRDISNVKETKNHVERVENILKECQGLVLPEASMFFNLGKEQRDQMLGQRANSRP